MARNYFRCPACGTVDLITYSAAVVGQSGWPPRCQGVRPGPDDTELPRDGRTWICATPMVFSPQPGDFAMDLHTDGGTGTSFQKFTVDVDGRATEIDSLHTLRRIERESEQRYRNGEGEPLRFRAWSQEKTNRDVGSFGSAGKIGERTYDSGTPAPMKKPAKVGVQRHGTQKPRVSLGPGMRGSASPLKG